MFGGIRGAVSRFWANDGPFLAGGLAFFFLVCLIPLLLLGVSTVGFVLSSEQAAREVVAQIARHFPVYSREITRALLHIVETRKVSGVLGTLILVLFSTSLFGAARLVMHRMLGVRPAPSFVRNLLRDAGMVLLLGVLLFWATMATWVLHWFQAFVLEPAQLLPGGWIEAVPIAFSIALSAAMFYLGYRYVPLRRVRVGAALAGAVMAALLWEVAKQLFRLYIHKIGLYDQIYGPLGVLAAMAMFVYYSAVVFVFGAAYVAALDARRR